MANKIIIKKSSVAAKIPLSTDLEVGEIAGNLEDQKLYSKKPDGTVVLMGSGLGGSGDVEGPASATNGAVALYDGTTGKLIKNGQVPGSIYTQNANNVNITGGSITSITDLSIADGGTGASTASAALTNLGAYPDTNPDGYTTNTGTVTSVSGTGTVNGISLSGTVNTSGDITLGGVLSDISLTTQVLGVLPLSNGGTNATTAAGARSNLGLGSAAVQNDTRYAHRANNLSDLNSAATARTNLGLGTAATTNATAYATAAQGDTADTALQPADVGTIASQNANNVNITGGSISDITDLSISDGGTGASTAAGARTSLGLGTAATTDATDYATAAQGDLADTALQPADVGTIASQDSNNVNITGGTVNPGTLQQGGSQSYVRSNILGTVSESSGLPTGSIIERGSNSNGEFVKFADGTLICTNRDTFIFAASNTLTYVWTFPASFINADMVVTVIEPARSNDRINVARGVLGGIEFLNNSESNGSFFLRAIDGTNPFISSTELINTPMNAVGRWY